MPYLLRTSVVAFIYFNPDELFDSLRAKGYIDRSYNIIPNLRLAFFEEYPDFFSGVAPGKVRDNNKNKMKHIIVDVLNADA